jgi:hypothetical protein
MDKQHAIMRSLEMLLQDRLSNATVKQKKLHQKLKNAHPKVMSVSASELFTMELKIMEDNLQ